MFYKWNLKWTGTSYNDTTGTYTLKRVTAGDRAITFPSNTPIILYGSKAYRETDLAVLWCFQNGGYSSTEDLVSKLIKMTEHLNTNKYVIIGLHSGTIESRQTNVSALYNQFGDKFLDWGRYAATNALYDFGITPSDSDISAMEAGKMPPTFLTDSVHMTATGYGILGFKIVERFKDLGYI